MLNFSVTLGSVVFILLDKEGLDFFSSSKKNKNKKIISWERDSSEAKRDIEM